MNIANNIIRNRLKNVYFIWGRGKTTIAKMLREKYGFYIYSTDDSHEAVVPEWVECLKVKTISWDDDISAEQTMNEVERYFGFRD